MSKSEGAVRFNDGKIMFFIYDGTSDICISSLHETAFEAWQNRKDAKCRCKENEKYYESVEIYSDYGNGFYWKGKACRACKVIASGLDPWGCYFEEGSSITNGKPDWYIEYLERR